MQNNCLQISFFIRTGFEDESVDCGEPPQHHQLVGGGGGEAAGVDTLTYKGLAAASGHKSSILSPMNPNLLNVEDIDADNLAADFDGSFTG